MNNENLRKIINLRHELHEHPELSGHESETKRRLMNFLENNTRLAVVDCGKWFYASRYVEGTKAIAFRADMDALPMDETISVPYASRNPSVSHKCGHDGHSAALCGLGLELSRLDVKRSVYLLFQHAEETGQGARECSGFLRERSISEIYAFHNWSGWPEKSIVVKKGVCHYASAGITLKFEGKSSHASEPEKGRNPAYVIAKLISELEAVNDRKKVLCTIVNVKVGGKNFGISPGDGEISLTIRAEHEQEMRKFYNCVISRADELAASSSMTLTKNVSDYFIEASSDSHCVERVRTAAESLGLNVIDMAEAIRASEDFGRYTKQIDGAIFYVGNGENYPAIHTREYDFNDNILETAVDVFREILVKF
ncbi:MAG: amidohydrolase [Synergistaceae bacterium]|nr:amidohydrolase [Synergistaceae bacterium]